MHSFNLRIIIFLDFLRRRWAKFSILLVYGMGGDAPGVPGVSGAPGWSWGKQMFWVVDKTRRHVYRQDTHDPPGSRHHY